MDERRHRPRKRAIAIRATVLLAAALLLAWGCCDGLRVKLGRVADYLSGVLEISADASIEMDPFSFGGDLAAWAEIPGFSEAEISADLSAAAWAQGEIAFDLDFDAKSEEVALLAAEDAALDAAVFFAKWRGDKYTADKGVCWLGWVEGDELRLAATWCGDSTGVMYCGMPASETEDPTCELCETSSGTCGACDLGARLSSCLPPQSGSIDVDVDIDIDIDIDVDMDVGGETCGAP